jgi:hypothetical protein
MSMRTKAINKIIYGELIIQRKYINLEEKEKSYGMYLTFECSSHAVPLNLSVHMCA